MMDNDIERDLEALFAAEQADLDDPEFASAIMRRIQRGALMRRLVLGCAAGAGAVVALLQAPRSLDRIIGVDALPTVSLADLFGVVPGFIEASPAVGVAMIAGLISIVATASAERA